MKRVVRETNTISNRETDVEKKEEKVRENQNGMTNVESGCVGHRQ